MPTIPVDGMNRPVLNLFYVLDTSGSMNLQDGKPITVLNRAVPQSLDAVDMEAGDARNSNARIKVSVLEFNSTCRWLNPEGPQDLDAFSYEPLTAVGGTNVGTMLRELNSKLSKQGFINAASGNLLPIIIFMTDGFATDEYEGELERIRKNNWFKHAVRIGFAIGRNPDTKMIAELTGSSETVIRTDELGIFSTLLSFVSQTSSVLSSTLSRIPSNGDTSGSRNLAVEAVRRAKERAGIDVSAYTPDFTYEEDSDDDGGTWGPEILDPSGFDVNRTM